MYWCSTYFEQLESGFIVYYINKKNTELIVHRVISHFQIAYNNEKLLIKTI